MEREEAAVLLESMKKDLKLFRQCPIPEITKDKALSERTANLMMDAIDVAVKILGKPTRSEK